MLASNDKVIQLVEDNPAGVELTRVALNRLLSR